MIFEIYLFENVETTQAKKKKWLKGKNEIVATYDTIILINLFLITKFGKS